MENGRVAVVLSLLMTIFTLCPCCGVVWDFSKGCPEGVHQNRNVAFGEGGFRAKELSGQDVPGGCVLKEHYDYPDAFRMELVFIPDAADAGTSRSGILWDDMRVTYAPKCNNRGVQLGLERKGLMWIPVLHVGYGDMTAEVRGPSVELQAGRTVVLSFTYDGNRRVKWDFAGEKSESIVPRSGAPAQGTVNQRIGDRGISSYAPVEATVSRVSIERIEREPLTVLPDGRMAFVRGEPDAKAKFSIENFASFDIGGLVVESVMSREDGSRLASNRVEVGTCRAGRSLAFALPIETRLRTGRVRLVFVITGTCAKGRIAVRQEAEVRIGPRQGDVMPTLMWGIGAVPALAEFGFTHGLAYNLGFRQTVKSGDDRMKPIRMLDEAVAVGVRLAKSLGVAYPDDGREEDLYWRRTREGAVGLKEGRRPVPEVSHPDMVAYARRVAKDNLSVFGDHPGLGGVLPVSENRDRTFPSFNTEHMRYRQETGFDVPAEIRGVQLDEGVGRRMFPDGVVPDDDPVLRYYRWFWKGGDGWPGYSGAVAEEYARELGRYGDGSARQAAHPFFSFWDPAVRCPPIWGSGGSCDCLNHWDYANREPLNVAGPLEEMFAMASGRPGQQVMMMTQLICYRSQIAPTNVVVSPLPEWAKRRPRADFPTIPPDILQEAVWAMLAKPVKGIMFHGWGTIKETGRSRGYCYTNPETAERIKTLLNDLVAPLGPSLKRLERRNPQVAVLESATTCFMGGPASWGWAAPAITYFQRARLDPRVVYEESVLRGDLSDVKVLYAPQCRFLPNAVILKIREFQRRGGLLLGDAEMLTSLKPDIVVPLVSFDAPPAEDSTEAIDAQAKVRSSTERTKAETRLAKEMMLNQCADVRKKLASRGYVPRIDSSTPELPVFCRQWKSTPYVFAINDKRTFGDYVGQWGLSMEKGLPLDGAVTVVDGRKRCQAVYELSRGGMIPFRRIADRIRIPLKFDTNDGRLLMLLTEPISDVRVAASESVRAGGSIDVSMTVLGQSGKPVSALLPVEIRVTDASGRELDGAGWACAVDGVCQMSVKTNLDDAPGEYLIVCCDRASGLKSQVRCRQERGAK